MPKLIIMCGLQGSGKSTFAQKLNQSMPNSVLLSSDEMRKRFNINNALVFEILYRQMNAALESGQDVIFDATNITIKDRTAIYRAIEVDPASIDVEVVVMATPYDECLRRVEVRNKRGDHFVPLDVVEQYRNKFQVPVIDEPSRILNKPLDGLSLIPSKKEFNLQKYAQIKQKMDAFEQKNPMHTSTLGKHCDEVMEHYAHYKDDKMHEQFALLHDYGKMFTQTFDSQGRAHYYSHANVGAYQLLTEDSDIVDIDSQSDFLGMIALVNYHMLAFDWASPKTNRKWTEILGEEMHRDLIEFNTSDQVRQ